MTQHRAQGGQMVTNQFWWMASSLLNWTNQWLLPGTLLFVSEMGKRIMLKGKVCFYRYSRGVFVWLLIHGVEMPSLVEAS